LGKFFFIDTKFPRKLEEEKANMEDPLPKKNFSTTSPSSETLSLHHATSTSTTTTTPPPRSSFQHPPLLPSPSSPFQTPSTSMTKTFFTLRRRTHRFHLSSLMFLTASLIKLLLMLMMFLRCSLSSLGLKIHALLRKIDWVSFLRFIPMNLAFWTGQFLILIGSREKVEIRVWSFESSIAECWAGFSWIQKFWKWNFLFSWGKFKIRFDSLEKNVETQQVEKGSRKDKEKQTFTVFDVLMEIIWRFFWNFSRIFLLKVDGDDMKMKKRGRTLTFF